MNEMNLVQSQSNGRNSPSARRRRRSREIDMAEIHTGKEIRRMRPCNEFPSLRQKENTINFPHSNSSFSTFHYSWYPSVGITKNREPIDQNKWRNWLFASFSCSPSHLVPHGWERLFFGLRFLAGHALPSLGAARWLKIICCSKRHK